jgi:hypothetical protein
LLIEPLLIEPTTLFSPSPSGMNLTFLYSSGPLVSLSRAEDLETRFRGRCEQNGLTDIAPLIVIKEDCSFEIQLVLDLPPGESDDAPVAVAAKLIAVLSDLSSEFGLTWKVGHQLEPSLGYIADGIPEKALMDEVLTAIKIAKSLSGLIVDDEFIDLEATAQDESNSDHTGDEESWMGLLEKPDSFIRFPEWG